MRTVNTWASSGINGDRTSCTTFIVDFDSESVVSCNICYPSYGAKRTHSRTPDDVKRLVRRRRIGAKQANARSGWCDWDQLSSHSISLSAAAGVCVDPVGVSSSEDGGVLVGCEG